MDYEAMKTAALTITMPGEMKYRIVRNCETQILNSGKEYIMKNGKNNIAFRKPAAVFAVLVICISLAVTTLAATGTLDGFFRDISDWRGAVVGTSYENASDEIGMDVSVTGNELTVLITFADPQAFPYREVERLGIAEYRIVDADGRIVKEGTAESAEVITGQAAVRICLDGIENGSYKLAVTAFVSEKKADQPMNISGSWECAFVK